MKRKMTYIGISYGIGLFFTSLLNSFKFSVFLTVIFLSALLTLKFLCKFSKKEIIVCVISFIIGFGVYTIYENTTYKQLVSYANGQYYKISGQITEIKDYDGDKSQYKIKATINNNQKANIIFYGDSVNCKYGDNIYLNATLEGFENTYKFSAKDYYNSKSIFLQVGEAGDIKITSPLQTSLINILLDYRIKIGNKICDILPDDEGEIMVGMLFGQTGSLDSSAKTAFYRTGIGHIMSVSGLHLVVFSAIIATICKKLKAHRYVTFISVEVMTLIFCICAGMAVSVIRSAIMITLIYVAELFQRRADTLNSLCISIILLTISSPFTITDPSFLLSVIGVYGIGVIAPYISSDIKGNKPIRKLTRNIIAMFCVSIVVLPVSMLYFDETSIVSPIANLLLIPICELALICGIIVFLTGGVSFIAYPLLSLAGICCRIVSEASKYIAKLPYTHIPLDFSFLKVTAVLLIIFSVLTFAIFRKGKYVRSSLIIWIPVFMVTSAIYSFINQDILSVSILGQDRNSVAIVVSKNGNNDIIDLTGNNRTVDYVSAYITKQGINRIGTLAIISKPYSLMTSYSKVFENLSVSNVMLPLNTYVLSGTEVCSNKPSLSAFSDTEIRYNDYNIKFLKNGAITINYGDYEFICIRDKSQLNSNSPEVLINYGRYNNEVFECGYLILMDKADLNSENVIGGENNVTIRCDKKGNIKIVSGGG